LRALASSRKECVEIACEKWNVLSRTILENKRESACRTNARNRGRREAERSTFRKFSQLFVQTLFHDLGWIFHLLPFVPLFQRNEHETVVAGAHETQQTEPYDGCGVLHTGCCREDLFNLLAHLIRSLQ